MTNYDKSKVSPRPWRTDHNQVFGSIRVAANIKSANGNYLAGIANETEWQNVDHIVHCVNMHDELVTALEFSYRVAKTFLMTHRHTLGAAEKLVKCYDLLTRAKGDK